MKCRNCHQSITPFFSVGMMPSVNHFLKKDQLGKEKKFDLTTAFCDNCYLVQLTHIIPPHELFSDYIYFSSTSVGLLKYFAETAEYLIQKLNLNKDSLVVEIASNDGAMLKNFKAVGIQILGIDPAQNIAKVANEQGITTLPEFFNLAFAQKLVSEKKIRADLIYGANVLAHVPEIVDFVQGVSKILNAKGTAIFEFPYVKGLLENKFDTIYHEHVFYYSLLAIQNIFRNATLDIYDVEMTPTQGGSLRIYACHHLAFPISERVTTLANKEKKAKFDQFSTYKKMTKRVEKLKKKLVTLLTSLKKDGQRLVGYGAAAKGVVLTNYFDIDEKLIEYVADKAPAKQGLYMPGVHLFVESPEKISRGTVDYVVIFSWNIAEEVMTQLGEYHQQGGKFIVPVPEVSIL